MILDISGAIYGATLFLDFFTQYPTVKKKKKKKGSQTEFSQDTIHRQYTTELLKKIFYCYKKIVQLCICSVVAPWFFNDGSTVFSLFLRAVKDRAG